MRTNAILELVRKEYQRQHETWPRHDWPSEYWMLILAEEVGEAAHEFLNERPRLGIDELVQCMAVLLSWIECVMEQLYDQPLDPNHSV